MQTEWEFERKFVVSYVPEGLLDTRKSVVIRQGYLATERDKHIRIRDEGGHYTMTVKQGMGLKRRDTRIELNAAQFNDLWPLTQNMRKVPVCSARPRTGSLLGVTHCTKWYLSVHQ